MRKIAFLFTVIGLAGPASAQQIGERTATPEAMLATMGPDADDASMEAEIAAAQNHPLGTIDNPVRVGGPEGERAYLARLRCADGSVPRIGDREEAGVGAFGTVVGAFALSCAGSPEARVVMDRYHAEHSETRAPQGFTITRAGPGGLN